MGDGLDDWMKHYLSERELKEVQLAQVYASDFHHGTTGHNQLMLISKLADMLHFTEQNGAEILCPPNPPE